MGFKTSLVIIQNPDSFSNEKELLKTLALSNYKYTEDTTFDQCMYPRDESINIGYYNNCIIIADDYLLTDQFIAQKVHPVERHLMALFPKSEILSVMCHSVVNAHGYVLLKNKRKVRAKLLIDGTMRFNKGKLIDEEEPIYARSVMRDGERIWPQSDNPEDYYLEEQLMEEFTFGVAARLLGKRIDSAGDTFWDLPFRKYKKRPTLLQRLMEFFDPEAEKEV